MNRIAQRKLDPQVIVETVMQARIQAADLQERPAPEERGRLHNKITVMDEPAQAKRLDIRACLDHCALAVDQRGVPVDQRGLCVILQRRTARDTAPGR